MYNNIARPLQVLLHHHQKAGRPGQCYGKIIISDRCGFVECSHHPWTQLPSSTHSAGCEAMETEQVSLETGQKLRRTRDKATMIGIGRKGTCTYHWDGTFPRQTSF